MTKSIKENVSATKNEWAEIRDGKTYLTDKALTLYKSEVAYWMDFFGLKDWKFITVESTTGSTQCHRQFKQRITTITSALVWDTTLYSLDKIESEIIECAYHEVLHVVLAGMNYIGLLKRKHKKMMYAEEEGAILRLTRLLELIDRKRINEAIK